MAEKHLYARVAQIAESRLGCSFVHQNVGTKLGKIDVVGIQELAGDLETDAEVVAIEVKDTHTAFLSSVGQAVGYSVYAHRCYLAVRKRYSRGFTGTERQVAGHFGIGLIELGAKVVEVPLTSRRFSPAERHVLQILQRIGLFRCVLCRSVYPEKEVSEINGPGAIDVSADDRYRGSLDRVIATRRNAKYYLFDLAERKGEKRGYVYDRRYLCKDCASLFASLLPKPAHAG